MSKMEKRFCWAQNSDSVLRGRFFGGEGKLEVKKKLKKRDGVSLDLFP